MRLNKSVLYHVKKVSLSINPFKYYSKNWRLKPGFHPSLKYC